MTLIEEARAREIYGMTGLAPQVSGGSVANTVADFAELGGRAAYIGRVRADISARSSCTTCKATASTCVSSPPQAACPPRAAISS